MKNMPSKQAAEDAFGAIDCAVFGEQVLTRDENSNTDSDDSVQFPRKISMQASTEPIGVLGKSIKQQTKPTGHIFCKKEVMNSIQRMVKME